MANFSVTESLFIAGGGELLQDLVRIAFALAEYVILRRISRFLTQPISASAALASGSDSGAPVLLTPTLYEWIALVQQDPEHARKISASLQRKLKKEGVMADPSISMSFAYYEQALRILDEKSTDPKQAQRMVNYTRIEQALQQPYPRYDDWLFLIDREPTFAQQLCIALEVKQATIGMRSPHDLVASIAIYHLITANSAPR